MRKKVLALIIILCLALGALAAFAACDNTGKLDTPTGFTLNRQTQTLTWKHVDNAYAYDFYVTDEQGNRSNVNNIRVQENEDGKVSQSLAGITASGTYTIHVQALANPDELDVSGNPVHQDSDVAEYTYVRGNRYNNPQNVVAEYTEAQEGSGVMGLRVTFDAVEGAANYTIQILSGSTLLTELSDTDSTSNWFETYSEKDSDEEDSDGNKPTERFSDNPGTYTVQVRANAASESNDIPSAWSRTSVNVTAQLSNPLITQYAFTSETGQRLRWTQVPNASSITVEAWKIDTTDEESLNDSALTLFQNIEKYAKNHDADYTYTTSSGTAQNTLLSSLNMTEAGEYLITVKANGNDTIYFSSPRVNTVTSSQATAESHLYTATVISPVNVSADMPADGNTVNVSFNDIKTTGTSGISDTLYIRFTQDILDNANMFKIILSSVNTSSSNSLSDVTASVRLELGTGENEGKIIIRSGSDEYEAATLTQEGDGYLLTYSLERIFHSAAEEGAQPTHNQSSSNMYGRYFNVSVQACYYQSDNIGASDEGLIGNVTAHLPSGSVTLETSCLSACEPEFDAATNTYTIKTTHLTNDEGDQTGVYATARAQLMYIQKLMLSGEDCEGMTFIIAEDVDFNNNAWLALDDISFKGTIKSADIEYSEGVTRSGEYTISNMHILNRAALEYARTEEHESALGSFTENYAMFPVFGGTLSHVNFTGVTATDAEYSYTVPGQEATEDTEATEDEEKYQRANTTAVIAGVNDGTIEYVYVGGTFEAINTSGVIAAVNNGTITACESDVSFSATAYSKLEEGAEGEDNTAYVGGLVGRNSASGTIVASSYRGDVSLTNTVLGNTALGGFVGLNEGTIENSFATGNISDGGTTVMLYTGGFAGSNAAGATITNSYYGSKFTAGAYGNIGEVRAEHVGGFVGSNAGTISYAYAVARVNGGATAGGFAAANSGTISYAYSAGTTRINTTVPSFVYGAATPENCFMYDYNGGEQGGSLAGLNNSALTSNGFSIATSYQTPVLDGLLYVESYSETVSIDGRPAITGVMTVDGSEYNIGYNSTATADGYTVTVYVTDGPGRFVRSGTALVKYVVTDSSSNVVSCTTITVTVR